MKFGIALNRKILPDNPSVLTFIRSAQRQGALCCMEDSGESFDILVSFGGDGTTVRFAKKYADAIPVVAVNMGTVGFLAQIQPDEEEIDIAVRMLVEGIYKVENRTLICVDGGEQQLLALNELAVCNADRGFTTTVGLTLDERSIGSVMGDGVIVCTPTGSTAYCQAVGGPVLTADSNCFAVMAIAPMNKMPPICFSDNSILRLDCLDSNTEFIVDGVKADFSVPCYISVTRSSQSVLMIRLKEDFFHKLLKVNKIKVAR